MNERELYYKDENGEFHFAGMEYERDMLGDGIWYVRHNEHSQSISSIQYLASMFRLDANPVDMNLLCGLEDARAYIMDSKEFRDVVNQPHSLQDIVSVCVTKIKQLSDECE